MEKTHATPTWGPGRILGLTVLLSAWFAAAYVVGEIHILQNETQSFFAPVALAVVLPVTLFFHFMVSGGPFGILSWHRILRH